MTSFLTICLSSGSTPIWWALVADPLRTSPSAQPTKNMASSLPPWPRPPMPPIRMASSPWPSISFPERLSTPKNGCIRMKMASFLTPGSWWSWRTFTALTATSSIRRKILTDHMCRSFGKCSSICGIKAFTFSGMTLPLKAAVFPIRTNSTVTTLGGSIMRPRDGLPTPSS